MTQPPTPVILVVDDEPADRKQLVAQLAVLGYATVQANSGRQALRMLATETVDAVMLDLIMPDISGLQVLHAIKGDRTTEALPVLAMTGVADYETRLAALASGAEELLSKPIDRLELGARLRNVLKMRTMVDRLRRRERPAGGATETDNERIEAAAWRALQLAMQPIAAGHSLPQVVRCGTDGRLLQATAEASYLFDLAADLFGRERLAAALRACALGQPQRLQATLVRVGPCAVHLQPSVVATGGGERVAEVLLWWRQLS